MGMGQRRSHEESRQRHQTLSILASSHRRCPISDRSAGTCASLPTVVSKSLQVPTDRPHRQISADELPDPIAYEGSRATESESDILRLTQEAA